MAILRMLAILAPSAVTLAGTAAALMPHTILIDNFKEITQSYRSGFPVTVTPHLNTLLLEVKSDLLANASQLESYDIKSEELNSVKPYTVFGFDMYNLGCMQSGYGGVLGIPQYFNHVTGEYITTSGILVNNSPVKWSSPEGQQLKKTLEISDEAKKFAIAREVLYLFQNQPQNRAAVIFANLAIVIVLGRLLQLRLQLFKRPMLVQGLVYGLVGAVGAATYVSMKDIATLQFDREVDKSLSELDDITYVRGGADYYASLVKRNIALRQLMGKEGEEVYTLLGNEEALIRTKCVPVVERAEQFRNALECRLQQEELQQKQPQEQPQHHPRQEQQQQQQHHQTEMREADKQRQSGVSVVVDKKIEIIADTKLETVSH